MAIKRKDVLFQAALSGYKAYGKKLDNDSIYDELIKRLFKNLLHKADENRIIIARRGKTARMENIQKVVDKARRNFEKKWDIKNTSQIKIIPAYPREYVGLQVIDYYLWALQRMYERTEDRFFNLLASHYRLIMDLDDKRNNNYGEWYSDSNPLMLEKIKPVTG